MTNRRDNFVWPHRNDGQYSVRTGYLSVKEDKDAKEESKLSKASTSQNLREVWETLWRLPMPQKWTRAVWFGSSLQIVPTVYNVRSFGKWMIDTIEKIKRETGKEQEKILSSERKRITWRPPPNNWLKVNTDLYFHKETGAAGSAVVVRDWQEKIVIGTTSTFRTISALAAEAQAYREALILIRNLQLVKCIIETDCLPRVQAIKAKVSIVEADTIIRDILQVLDEAPNVRAT
ncbi:hypothetical protein Ahy_B05g076665 [Arachis hypogaea]|uniref:RNase H type-1 domain-containing protein n=1 Tax=Arachis hypogaea TaxID=3818 RepID=A0A444Z3R1_ARAHY|nr:hypothetical protein Ahy_B05g076665 [Arachis hypogaea]